MSSLDVFLQLLIIGISNGMIIALIALGYTMVYGIIELINFAHGDLFMLGSFLALTLLAVVGVDTSASPLAIIPLLIAVPLFCALLNVLIERFAYRPLRAAPKLALLVSAIGVSFILVNLGLFWGGLPLDAFSDGNAAAAPKNFPALLSTDNLFSSVVALSWKDIAVMVITLPLMVGLTLFIKCTKLGRAMRAVAQNPVAAQLMGIDKNRVVSLTFFIGGALAGIASVIYAAYNNTIHFQMGYRVGMDAFTAAVLGGIGNMPGAMLGGLVIGVLRAMSDQYIEARWTNAVVFAVLILFLVFRPSGLLGARVREKV